jgi:hypothetical protein
MYMHLISDGMMFTVYWFTRVLNLYHNATRFVESFFLSCLLSLWRGCSRIQLSYNDPFICDTNVTV